MICIAIKIHLFRPTKSTQKLNFISLMKFSLKIKSSVRDTVFLPPKKREREGNNKNQRQLLHPHAFLYYKKSHMLKLVPGFAS